MLLLKCFRQLLWTKLLNINRFEVSKQFLEFSREVLRRFVREERKQNL
jgi:hypothetical protein